MYRKMFAQGKIKRRKNHARQLTLKNNYVLVLKNLFKENVNEKKIQPCGSNSPPP